MRVRIYTEIEVNPETFADTDIGLRRAEEFYAAEVKRAVRAMTGVVETETVYLPAAFLPRDRAALFMSRTERPKAK